MGSRGVDLELAPGSMTVFHLAGLSTGAWSWVVTLVAGTFFAPAEAAVEAGSRFFATVCGARISSTIWSE
jgi:hypothetical protein